MVRQEAVKAPNASNHKRQWQLEMKVDKWGIQRKDQGAIMKHHMCDAEAKNSGRALQAECTLYSVASVYHSRHKRTRKAAVVIQVVQLAGFGSCLICLICL